MAPEKQKKYNDNDLVKGCIDNSRYHQEMLYKKYFPDCYYMCLRYAQDDEIVRQIINDGFLQIFKNIHKYSGTGSLKAWIKRIVFNAMSDHFRRESRYMKMIILEEKDKVVTQPADHNLYYDDILKMVDKLGDTTKDVFRLYAIDGYNHREIAHLLNISEGNSKWHLHKARKILQEMITNKEKIKRHA